MRRAALPFVIALLLAGLIVGSLPPGDEPGLSPATGPAAAADASRAPADRWLPPEATDTLALIAAGGPFPYRRDGVTFENREGRLPARDRGYYREYTVPTPGSADRGARRIVTGGDPPDVYYYTDDHYRSFRRLEGLP